MRAGIDILRGIENVGDLIFRGGGGNELHEAAGLFAGDGVNVEIGFDGDDAANEIGVDAVFFGGVVDECVEGGSGRGERRRVGGEHVFRVDGKDVGFGNREAPAGHGEDEIRAVVSVASDVEAFASAEDGVVGARGGRGEEEEGCGGEKNFGEGAACESETRRRREAAVIAMGVSCAGHAAKKPGDE